MEGTSSQDFETGDAGFNAGLSTLFSTNSSSFSASLEDDSGVASNSILISIVSLKLPKSPNASENTSAIKPPPIPPPSEDPANSTSSSNISPILKSDFIGPSSNESLFGPLPWLRLKTQCPISEPNTK